MHLESTQSELDQLKDILNGYNSFDANALLGVIFMYQIKKCFISRPVCSCSATRPPITGWRGTLRAGTEIRARVVSCDFVTGVII